MGGGRGREMEWEGEGRRSTGECGGGLLRRPIKCRSISAVSIYQGFFLVSHRQQDGVPGRDSIPAKITIIEIPSRKEELPRCFRGGCVSYGTNCAPFWGREGKRFVGCGWSDWWGLVQEGGGCGGEPWSKLRLVNGSILGKSICKSHAFLAYKYCNPPSSNWTMHSRF